MIDEIDKIILYSLVENARMSSIEITRVLNDLEYTITERAVRYRLKKLEKDGVILGYSALINPFYINDKINKLLLIKFRIIKDSSALFERLKKYVDDSAFCIYSCKIHGDFDFVCHFILDSNEQFDLEMDSFINQFSDLIADFRTFDSGLIKFNYHSLFNDQNVSQKKLEIYKTLNSLKSLCNINHKFQFIVESLVKYFDATFARIWIVDERKENLILKCSAGKYTRCNGEFSKVSVGSNKIGYVFRTKKPAITNDVPHDARIKYPQWAKQENLKSFAGYPLTYNGEPMGVLALFSEKRLKPIEFELIGIFCENVSKELSNFLDDQKFLFTNKPE